MEKVLTKSRRTLYRWAGWFFLINTILSFFVIINYLKVTPDFGEVSNITTSGFILGWAFFLISFVVQMATLFFVCCLLVLLMIAIVPRRWLAFFLGVLLSTVAMFVVIGDSVAYTLYHMHYAKVALAIFKASAMSEVILLSLPERIFIVTMIVVLFLFEYLVASVVWRRVSKQKPGSWGYKFASLFFIFFVFSYGLMFVVTTLANKQWLTPSDTHVVLKAARVVPYFNEIYEAVVPGDLTVRKFQTPKGEVDFQVNQINKFLRYPSHSLHYLSPKNPFNIVIITIDTWRYDSMNKTVTPHIDTFSQHALQFEDHWSGGNCTESGVFSMFYGIPANYWRAMLRQHQGPVLIRELMHANYEMGIFASAPLTFPAFNQTIFQNIQNLPIRTKGNTSVSRDQEITRKFQHFLARRDKHRPFFGFLFYDAAHNYCESKTPHQKPFQPAAKACQRFSLTSHSDRIPYLNRYHNAVYFVDGEVGKVIQELKKHHLLKNTIVMITGDHGEQLDDERMNYWDHASAYTPYQLHIPLLVYWPGKQPRKIMYFTSHYDIVPTLMTLALNCVNFTKDYSIGRSLFVKGHRPFLIAGSYGDYAVVTKKWVTRIYEGGDYVINNPTGHHLNGASLEVQPLRRAFRYLNQYFGDAK